MGMIYDIQNNTAALTAEKNLGISTTSMNQSLQRLSSGYRINSAKDDASGLSISNLLTSQVAGANIAQQNISQATSLLQVGDGGMSAISDILTRMNQLATEAASAGADIAPLQNEYATLGSEIDRIANSTQYNGTPLLNGAGSSGSNAISASDLAGLANIFNANASSATVGAYTVAVAGGNMTLTSGGNVESLAIADGAQTMNFKNFGISFQTTSAFSVTQFAAQAASLTTDDVLNVAAGASSGTSMTFQIGYANDANDELTVTLSGVTSADLNLSASLALTPWSSADAQNAMTAVANAIGTLSNAQAANGTYENRLNYASENLTSSIQNLTSANSAIKDVDMASEMTNFTKEQILVQAGTAMLAQANTAPQQVLALFK
jgi:flagellin